MLVSSNNRPVGRSADQFHGYPACRTAALFLRAQHSRTMAVLAVVETGQWAWRVSVDGVCIALALLAAWCVGYLFALSGLAEARSQRVLYGDLRERLAQATEPIGGYPGMPSKTVSP